MPRPGKGASYKQLVRRGITGQGSVQYVDPSNRYDETGQPIDTVPAKGTFQDTRSWIDLLRGVPDSSSAYNAQLTLNDLAAKQTLASNIAQAKALAPINTAQAVDQATQLGVVSRLGEQAKAEDLAQKQAQDMALYMRGTEQPTDYAGNLLAPNDPSLLGQARLRLQAPGYTGQDASASSHVLAKTISDAMIPNAGRVAQLGQESNVATDQADIARNILDRDVNRAKLIQAPLNAVLAQSADMAGSRLNAARNNLSLDEHNQNRLNALGASGYRSAADQVAAKNTLAETQAASEFAPKLPAQKFRGTEANTLYNEDVKRRIGESIIGKNEADAKKAAAKDPAAIMNALKSVLGDSAATPTVTTITPTEKPGLLSNAKEGIDYEVLQDGRKRIKRPLMNADGTIIPAGAVTRAK